MNKTGHISVFKMGIYFKNLALGPSMYQVSKTPLSCSIEVWSIYFSF